MAEIIPLAAVPSQTLTVSLNNQTCQIDIFQKLYGLFCNLYVNNSLIIAGVICQDRNRIVRDDYLGFIGDLMFIDTDARIPSERQDPVYTGLGTRFSFTYLTPDDVLLLEAAEAAALEAA